MALILREQAHLGTTAVSLLMLLVRGAHHVILGGDLFLDLGQVGGDLAKVLLAQPVGRGVFAALRFGEHILHRIGNHKILGSGQTANRLLMARHHWRFAIVLIAIGEFGRCQSRNGEKNRVIDDGL